jgi:type II secretory pathway pseudopilin PulG
MNNKYPTRTMRRKKCRGFTLVEVAISMLMFVVGVLPIIVLMVLARRVDNQAKIQAAAYNIARQEIDTLRAQSWGNRSPVTQASFTIPTSVTNEFPNQTMTGDYNVVTNNATFPAVQQIAVRVRWYRADSASYNQVSSIVLDTLTAQGAGK